MAILEKMMKNFNMKSEYGQHYSKEKGILMTSAQNLSLMENKEDLAPPILIRIAGPFHKRSQGPTGGRQAVGRRCL